MASMLAADVSVQKKGACLRKVIEMAVAAGDPGIAFQPIVELPTRRLVGYEALSHFARPPWHGEDKAAEM